MKKTNSNGKRALRSRTLRFEALESRELLAADVASFFTDSVLLDYSYAEAEFSSAVASSPDWYDLSSSNLNPSDVEQELLEQINRFRINPQGEVDRIFSVATDDELLARNNLVNMAINLTSYPRGSIDVFLEEMRSVESTPPLAFHPTLISAATAHTSYMKARNDISHQCTGEDSLEKRLNKAGFQFGYDDSATTHYGENIGGSFFEQDGFSIASYMHAAFVVDWGIPSHSHRDALAGDYYTEIGISVQSSQKSVGPYLVTCDFGKSVDGARTDGAYLLGVVFDDVDGDRFYDVGEGLGNVSVLVERTGVSGEVESVAISTWNSGGYQLFLLNGSYRVTVSGDGFNTSVTKSVVISDGTNAKLDFLTSDAGEVAPVIDLNGEAEGRDWNVVFVEGSEEPIDVFASSKLTITDDDSAYLYGAKIYLGDRPDGINEFLDVSVGSTSITASFDEQSGNIVLDGPGSIEEYESVIASLSYFNEAEYCDLTNHSISFSVFDGTNWSEEAVLTVSIQPTKLPNMTVHELFVYEGDEGTKAVNFVVELDMPARLDVSFNFNVAVGGTAVEGEDFVVSKGDPIVIAKGEKFTTIECYVVGNYDSLKPEGLKRVEDGYENPSTNFFLEIIDLANAYLTNDNSLAEATIYDDDSPIVLGKTNAYSFENVLSSDNGQRRYVFSLTPETNGLFTWNADSLGVPEGTVISVREFGLESEPIAVSKTTLSGGNVQWFADSDVEYWISVEADADFSSLAAKLLPITDEKVVLVDPIFDDAETNLVQLMWEDEDVQVSLDNLFWNLDSDYWNGTSFRTERNDLEFAMRLPAFSNGVTTETDDNGSTDFLIEDRGSITTVGFAAFHFYGEDENENITFSGTSGNDYLYYSDGSGYFQRSDGKMFTFSGVNNVTIDGAGGFDNAYIEDTPFDDRFETNNDMLALYGGGFSLTAKKFSDVRALFNKGGEDSYFASDHGDDVKASISKMSAILSGTFATIENGELNQSEELLTDPSSEAALVYPYIRTIVGVEHINLVPEDSIGSVVLHGDNSASAFLDVQVGNLTTYNKRTDSTTTICRAKSLTISGLNPNSADRLMVNMPETYQTREEGDTLIVEDSATGWTMSIPIWKDVNSVSAALLDDQVEMEEHLDSFFSMWNEEDAQDFELDSIFVDFIASQESYDAFALVHSLKERKDRPNKDAF